MSGIGPGFAKEADALHRAYMANAITLSEYREGLRRAGLVLKPDQEAFPAGQRPALPAPLARDTWQAGVEERVEAADKAFSESPLHLLLTRDEAVEMDIADQWDESAGVLTRENGGPVTTYAAFGNGREPAHWADDQAVDAEAERADATHEEHVEAVMVAEEKMAALNAAAEKESEQARKRALGMSDEPSPFAVPDVEEEDPDVSE